MLLPSTTAVPLRAAGVHPVVAYNILFLSGFLFSALATYVLVERLTGSSRAAFVSALIYGFYPYRFEHYSHLELQMTHWMPLALIWLHRFSATLKVRDAIAVALLAAAQLYSSMYYGVFFALYAGAVLGTLLLVARQPWRRLLVPVASALAVAILLAAPLARPYLAAQAVKGDRDEGSIRVYSAGPSDYFRAHPRSATYGGRLLADRYPERALFPGTLPLALSAVALVPPVGAIRLAYAAGLVAAFDLSLGFNGVTYKHLYRWFLPIRGLRVPARMSIVLAISLAVLAAFGARRLFARFKTAAGRTVVFGAMVLAAAVDVWPAITLHRVWWRPPPIYDALKGQQVVLAEFPTHLNISHVTNARALHVLLDLALVADDQRLQRLHAGELRAADGRPARFSGAGDDRSAAVERGDARHGQLRVVCDRLRARFWRRSTRRGRFGPSPRASGKVSRSGCTSSSDEVAAGEPIAEDHSAGGKPRGSSGQLLRLDTAVEVARAW